MSHLTRGLIAFVLVLALLAAAALAWMASGPGPMAFATPKGAAPAAYAGPDPTGVPAALAKADLATKGEYLTRAADCEGCHTAEGGKPFAGGRPFKTDFGTIYSTNITPDRLTGIGGFTDAEFLRSMKRGVGQHGQALYPAFPYDAYAHMADADALAIKAWLFTLKPIAQVTPKNRLKKPFDQRWLIGVWQALFNREQGFKPVGGRSSEWNRGAYLAEALAHCGACHTPRWPTQNLDNRRKFKGAIASGWKAYNITSDRLTGVGAWSDGELLRYLTVGHSPGRGAASGPMGEAVDLGLSHLAPSDAHAVVVYLRTIPALKSPDLSPKLAGPAPSSPVSPVGTISEARGKRIFEGACASCHGWTGHGQLTTWATLTGDRAVNDPSGTNVAQIVISGSRRRTPTGEVFMPAFGKAYSDAEIAAVANYVTGRFGAQPSRLHAADVAKLRQE